MKLVLLLLAGLLSLRALASGQASIPDPNAGRPVDCGNESVVPFAHTASSDGRYALVWTVRGHRASAKAVDWTSYMSDPNSDWLKGYPAFVKDFSPDGYDLLNGVVDLAAKKFFPLSTTQPFQPDGNHHELWAAWLDSPRGKRYALVANNSRWSTSNLWLITLDVAGAHAIDLQIAAEAAVRHYVSKHAPREHHGYAVGFFVGKPSSGGPSAGDPFAGKRLNVPYETVVPRSSEGPNFTGHVGVALPSGKILGVDGGEQ